MSYGVKNDKTVDSDHLSYIAGFLFTLYMQLFWCCSCIYVDCNKLGLTGARSLARSQFCIFCLISQSRIVLTFVANTFSHFPTLACIHSLVISQYMLKPSQNIYKDSEKVKNVRHCKAYNGNINIKQVYVQSRQQQTSVCAAGRWSNFGILKINCLKCPSITDFDRLSYK